MDNSAGRSVPSSPSIATSLDATGLRGKITGVTRIGSRAGLVAVAVLGAVVLAIVYGLTTSGNHRPTATIATQTPQILATTGPLFANIPGADGNSPAPARRLPQQRPVPVRPRVQAPPVLPDPATQTALVRGGESVPDIHALPPGGQVQAPPQAVVPVQTAADVARALKLERERQALQVAEAARHSAIMIGAGVPGGGAGGARTAPLTPAAMTVPAAAAAAAAPATPDPNEDPSLAAQRAKTEFVNLQKSTTADDYLTTPRQAAISPYEVQAGSIIPAILITGINSDLPGQMIGQVSQNVYDSKTGTYLLIPAGAKLVGRYDSQVTNGQSRVLVAWQRILFPDASFIDIGGMAGSDTAGYAGLTGKVDDHSGKLFRNAILFSLIGAGATLLQPRTAVAALTGGVGAVVQAPSVGSQVAGQVGTQISQVAQQATQRGLQQQPTIEVRPGYLFNITVDRDLVLPGPYTSAK